MKALSATQLSEKLLGLVESVMHASALFVFISKQSHHSLRYPGDTLKIMERN